MGAIIMMREIRGVVQDDSRARRRWFHDEYFDLFVWQNDANEITSFQLCYGIDSSERALEWHKNRGFFHDGAKPTKRVAGTILDARLGPVDAADANTINSRFEFAARALPEDLHLAVSARIREYANMASEIVTRRQRVRRKAWQLQESGTS